MSHCVQEPVLSQDSQIQTLLSRARAAQAAFESFSQEQVDAIVKGIGKYVYDNAEMLARMAVDETGHRRTTKTRFSRTRARPASSGTT